MWAGVAWPLVCRRSKGSSWKNAEGSWEQRTWTGFESETGTRAGPMYLEEVVVGGQSYLQL